MRDAKPGERFYRLRRLRGYIRNVMKKRFLSLVILIFAFCIPGLESHAAGEPLVWNQKEQTFDADFSGMELRELLQKVSALTGWEVYLEPETSFQASAKFKNLPRAEALRRLLGKLNFEISPQKNSVPKLFVFRTGAGNATQLVSAEKKAKIILGKDDRILNQLIVTLKPGSKISIEVLAQQLGGKVVARLDGLGAYLLEFPDEAAANAARDQLSRVSDVASVDPNYSLEKPSPFAMSATNGGSPFNLKADANGGNGNNLVIGLIDTAVQQLGADMQVFLLPGLSIDGGSSALADVPTHGTAMAESILFGANSMIEAGKGTSLRILPVDIYGTDSGTTTFKVASGVTLAVNNGANILSLSLGSEGNSRFLEELLLNVREKGILVFAAAGNRPVTTPVYPAAYSSVIAVTSAANSGTKQVASYANRGAFVDVILPGSTIVRYNGSSYYVNGTSVSAALGSGMMAGLSERSRRPPAQLEETFRNTVRFEPPKP